MLTTASHVRVKAARCKHDEAFIFIDAENTIYAEDEEHVPGELYFFAASPCTLFFEKGNRVFEDQYSLVQGMNQITATGKGKTAYAINRPPDMKGDPKIVVP